MHNQVIAAYDRTFNDIIKKSDSEWVNYFLKKENNNDSDNLRPLAKTSGKKKWKRIEAYKLEKCYQNRLAKSKMNDRSNKNDCNQTHNVSIINILNSILQWDKVVQSAYADCNFEICGSDAHK